MVTDKNRIDYIMAYEDGSIDDKGVLELFSHLIKNGMCWSLQGHYGRTASALIENDYVNRNGEINWCLINSKID
tara:strand:+ start:1947 stop:2168 length:222 start_codon:yes stop_codon:yes gene_type:complete